MINEIKSRHFPQILKINEEFVHWLSHWDEARMKWVLARSDYARQIDEAQAVLIGYPHDVDYPEHHKNLDYLSRHLDNYFYIDRIIIDSASQGQGYGRILYEDMAKFARARGYDWLACEVNTKPDNPGSHAFHLKMGFEVMGDQAYPQYEAALRYYKKKL